MTRLLPIQRDVSYLIKLIFLRKLRYVFNVT